MSEYTPIRPDHQPIIRVIPRSREGVAAAGQLDLFAEAGR